MGCDVDDGEEDEGPGCGFVEGDVFVEGDEGVERGTTAERDEVTADWEEDKCDIYVENERGCTSDCYVIRK